MSFLDSFWFWFARGLAEIAFVLAVLAVLLLVGLFLTLKQARDDKKWAERRAKAQRGDL
jgi:hypothetical protein